MKAEETKIECHGVLWIIEELAKMKAVNSKVLLNALKIWIDDPYVRLPQNEFERLILLVKSR